MFLGENKIDLLKEEFNHNSYCILKNLLTEDDLNKIIKFNKYIVISAKKRG
jgi:hypothetical protein